MRYYVSGASVSKLVESGGRNIRAEFVDVKDDYKLEQDMDDWQHPFTVIREAFCEEARAHVPRSEAGAWSPGCVTILGITPICEDSSAKASTLTNRVHSLLQKWNIDVSTDSIIRMLPECADVFDDVTLERSVKEAVDCFSL